MSRRPGRRIGGGRSGPRDSCDRRLCSSRSLQTERYTAIAHVHPMCQRRMVQQWATECPSQANGSGAQHSSGHQRGLLRCCHPSAPLMAVGRSRVHTCCHCCCCARPVATASHRHRAVALRRGCGLWVSPPQRSDVRLFFFLFFLSAPFASRSHRRAVQCMPPKLQPHLVQHSPPVRTCTWNGKRCSNAKWTVACGGGGAAAAFQSARRAAARTHAQR